MHDDIDRAAGALERAYAEGALSAEAKDALLAIGNAGVEIGRSLGTGSESREILLVTVLVDDSASIGEHDDEVRRGHNLLLEALDDQGEAEILVLTRYLTGRI